MEQSNLFELPDTDVGVGSPKPALPAGQPRLRRPVRDQIELHWCALNDLLPEDHSARVIWQFADQADLSPLLDGIAAVDGEPGRNATDPRILLSLWLYATSQAVGSARELDRLCESHMAYQWLCGGVSVNYHMLSDFRTDHGALLDDLLTHSLAVLMRENLLEIRQVAQDGVRVRASAGTSSFRRRPKLEECLAQAEAQVQALRTEVDADPSAGSRRQRAARERATHERKERLVRALEELRKVEEQKSKRGRDSLDAPARASTTDPEARKMKMADGGFRPAYNVQFATDTQTQVMLGADVVNVGSDAGQLQPMVEQIEDRTGQRPREMLADGGFSTLEEIDRLNDPEQELRVYTPVKDEDRKRLAGEDPFVPQPTDSPRVAEWRVRMGTEEARVIYRRRAATAECVNALARQRGLQQFRVRGLAKVRAIALWYALIHNVLRTVKLRAEAAQRAAAAGNQPK